MRDDDRSRRIRLCASVGVRLASAESRRLWSSCQVGNDYELLVLAIGIASQRPFGKMERLVMRRSTRDLLLLLLLSTALATALATAKLTSCCRSIPRSRAFHRGKASLIADSDTGGRERPVNVIP
ncbi:hypothetical protein BJX76DRAFT_328084 [Aspergillus varians]